MPFDTDTAAQPVLLTSEHETMRREVLRGLRAAPPTLPFTYFYDAVGSALFDRITALGAYYPTRTETAILREHGAAMAALVPDGAALVEYGAGSLVKTRLLLDHLPRVGAYVPLDVSREHLLAAADRLAADYPHLRVEPLVADYTVPVVLDGLDAGDAAPRVLFFPGSTIGNFSPEGAVALLRRMADTAGPDGRLILGVDLRKDRETLEAAYDDPEGVTAAFNRNLLVRLNRDLGATFDMGDGPDGRPVWRHRAVWMPDAAEIGGEPVGRVEMHLVATGAQTVEVAGERFTFAAGESIHTESAHKYTPGGIDALALAGGWRVTDRWLDAEARYSVQHLVRGDVDRRGGGGDGAPS